MAQSKYRKHLNKVLVNYVDRTQPLIEKYEDNGFGIADYVLHMAGDMFVAADKLKE